MAGDMTFVDSVFKELEMFGIWLPSSWGGVGRGLIWVPTGWALFRVLGGCASQEGEVGGGRELVDHHLVGFDWSGDGGNGHNNIGLVAARGGGRACTADSYGRGNKSACMSSSSSGPTASL